MTNSLKTAFVAAALAAGAMTAGIAEPAHAAGYLKMGDIKGEVKAVSWGASRAGAQTLWITTEEDPQQIGLLLPAVQKVREAAARRSAPRGRSVSSFELTDGGKVFTIYGAQIQPTSRANRVKVVYRCKDWRDSRTGKTGGDCAEAAGKKGGNVEYEWKVEEGES